MPPTGGIIPGQNFATVKLLKYVTAYDYAVLGEIIQTSVQVRIRNEIILNLGGEFIFAVFILYFIIEEFLEMKKMRMDYFQSFWNMLDLFVIMVIFRVAFKRVKCLEANSIFSDIHGHNWI